MKRLFLFLPLSGALALMLLAMNACQKETALESLQPDPIKSSNDRSASHRTYGVTLYDGVTPCRIVEIDQSNGNVTPGSPTAFYVDNNGFTINLDNLKGICLTSWGQYFLTTGNPVNPVVGPASIYNNALFKVNPLTGQSSYASSAPAAVGTVSDLEFNPNTNSFFGLSGNNNGIVEIQLDANNNYTVYLGPFPVTGLPKGYTLKGLSLVRDNVNGTYLVGCATNPSASSPAKLYSIPNGGGFATFLTDLDPLGDLAAGHCGIGFDLDLNNMVVNRTNSIFSPGLGLNDFQWAPPFAATTPTAFWGAAGIDFEDLTSSVY